MRAEFHAAQTVYFQDEREMQVSNFKRPTPDICPPLVPEEGRGAVFSCSWLLKQTVLGFFLARMAK
jgi:hypothetical protein